MYGLCGLYIEANVHFGFNVYLYTVEYTKEKIIMKFNKDNLVFSIDGAVDAIDTAKKIREEMGSIVPKPHVFFLEAVYDVYDIYYSECGMEAYMTAYTNIRQVNEDIRNLDFMEYDMKHGKKSVVFDMSLPRLVDKTIRDIEELSDILNTALKMLKKHIEAGDRIPFVVGIIHDYETSYSFLCSIQQLVVEPLYHKLLNCYDNAPEYLEFEDDFEDDTTEFM